MYAAELFAVREFYIFRFIQCDIGLLQRIQ